MLKRAFAEIERILQISSGMKFPARNDTIG
jgi:hypothetical protein